ncbi:hypothetical protein ACPA9J_15990 [Pseudomonas aeruginosa]
MDDVLAAGYAEKTIKRGVISAARDEPRTTFGHMYSPQNMDGPLRISISAPSEDDYDGVDVYFVNANGWIEDTVRAACPAMSAGRSRRSRLSVSQTAIAPGATGCAAGWLSDTGEQSIRSIPAWTR